MTGSFISISTGVKVKVKVKLELTSLSSNQLSFFHITSGQLGISSKLSKEKKEINK